MMKAHSGPQKPRLDRNAHQLPDPDGEYQAYLSTCRARMRQAVVAAANFGLHAASLERHFNELYGSRVGPIEAAKDLDYRNAIGARDSTRTWAQTYALTILAETTLHVQR